MKAQTNTEIFNEVKNTGIITEKQISLIKSRSNKENTDLWNYNLDEIECTKEQTQKGLKWLINLWQTPKGKERLNNPFGYKEIKILKDKNAKAFFDGFYNIGGFYACFVPIYTIYGNGKSFQYYANGKNIKIIG